MPSILDSIYEDPFERILRRRGLSLYGSSGQGLDQNELLRSILRNNGGDGPDGLPVSYTPEQEESLIADAISGTTSGLAKAGNLLDVPGSMARDIIAGLGSGDWKKYNPLDQILSPLQGTNRASGRDVLTETLGVAPNDPNAWEIADFAGFGVELLADPLLPLGLGLGGKGALGTAGKLLKRAGGLSPAKHLTDPALKGGRALMDLTLRKVLDKSPGMLPDIERAAKGYGVGLAEYMDEPLSSLATYRIPLTKKTHMLGTGERAKDFADAFDAAFQAVKYARPVRHVRSLADPRTLGEKSRAGQEIAEVVHALTPGHRREARQALHGHLKNMAEGLEGFREELGDVEFPAMFGPADMDAKAKSYRAFDYLIGLGAERKGRVAEAAREVFPGVEFSPEMIAKMDQAGQYMKEANDAIHRANEQMGGAAHFLPSDASESFTDQIPRFAKHFNQPRRGQLPIEDYSRTVTGSSMGRNYETSMMDRKTVEKLLLSPEGRGDDAREWLRENFLQYKPPFAPRRVGYVPGENAGHIGLGRAEAPLEDETYISKLHEYLLERKEYPYGNLYGEDFYTYQKQEHRQHASLHAAHDMFSKQSKPLKDLGLEVPETPADVARTRAALKEQGYVLLEDAFTGAKMRPKEASRFQISIGNPDALMEPADNAVFDAYSKSYAVTIEHANGAKGLFRVLNDPEWLKTIQDWFDPFTKMFKENVTLPFPGFSVRNLLSGQFVNAIASGEVETLQDLTNYFRHVTDGLKLAKTPYEKMSLPQREMVERASIDRIFTRSRLSEGVEGPRVESFKNEPRFAEQPENVLFGGGLKERHKAIREYVTDPKEKLVETGLKVIDKPLDWFRRRTGLRTAHQHVVKGGAAVNQNVEWLNRMPMYTYLQEKGYTPAEAARRVEELQFNYKDATPFEREVASRVVPFWAFSKKMTALMLKDLTHRPGGGMGQAIRMSALAGDPETDVFKPDYIAQTAAIPWGGLASGEPGTQYLTGLGLGHEDPLSFDPLAFNPISVFRGESGGAVQGAGLEMLSRLHPLIKGPLEAITGQSFFQRGPIGGRPLEDLDPVVGRTVANVTGNEDLLEFPGSQALDRFITNTPPSRYFTTARQASELFLPETERRKTNAQVAMNLLSGFRTTAVAEKSKDAILREHVQKLMRGMVGGREFTTSYFPRDVKERMSPDRRAVVERLEVINKLVQQRSRKRRKQKELSDKIKKSQRQLQSQ